MYIPTSEIVFPDLHADNLGFVFEWKGHLLRGIYPDSKLVALSYFESGFIDRICGENLFPKTWISDYENDRFAFIIEHERITPIINSTEWNYSMLYHAAKTVLKIAKIASEYGYNMIDCHSSNVLFNEMMPYYVDLGSFVPNPDGCTAWRPYQSFRRSYLYLIKLWYWGSGQIVKRMLSPGIEMNDIDYFLYKRPIYRRLPFLLNGIINIREKFLYIASSEWNDYKKRPKLFYGIKRLVNQIRLLPNQNIGGVEKKMKRFSDFTIKKPMWISKPVSIEYMHPFLRDSKGVIVFNNHFELLYEKIWEFNPEIGILSVQEDLQYSESEFKRYSGVSHSFCTVFFKLFNEGYIVRKQDPVIRLKQDFAYIPNLSIKGDAHNAIIYIREVLQYSKRGIVAVGVHNNGHENLIEDIVKAFPHYNKIWEDNSYLVYVFYQ